MVILQSKALVYTFCRKMTTSNNVPLGPVGVRGMKSLDREKFLRNLQVPVLKVSEDNLSKVIKVCKPFFFKLDNFKPVRDNDVKVKGNEKKCIYLNPEKISKWSDLPQNDQKALENLGIHISSFCLKDIQVGYENWKVETIFKAVLPENEESVSGYSRIGHLIHLNLREHLFEYKSLIGQVLIDKIKGIRTVVNKTQTIDNSFRNFSMEVVAGKGDFLVVVKENNCLFQFDFSKVYWNPRLGKEHERILHLLSPGDVLFDVFCGVGPFSVPAAKRKCKVFANDLNPESFNWLNFNAKRNKVNNSLFKSFNLDGKDFILNTFKDYLIELCTGKEVLPNGAKIHVAMNLPALAVDFLQYFKGLLTDEFADKLNFQIIVYVYCFVFGDDCQTKAKQLVNKKMNQDVSQYISDVFFVRDVAPKKNMMRVTLKLGKEILCSKSEQSDEPPDKKVCVGHDS